MSAIGCFSQFHDCYVSYTIVEWLIVWVLGSNLTVFNENIVNEEGNAKPPQKPASLF